MRFAQPNFPGKTGVLDGSQRRRAGAAIVAADGDDIGACFGYARGDDADAGAGNELYADASARIHGAEVVNQLREIFDAVDVVMRGRRNQRRARSGMADARDVFADFLGGELAAFAGLGALRHFDFEFFGMDKIVGGDAKAAGGDLFDFVGRGGLEAVGLRIFAAFAGIAAATELVHGQRERAVRFGTERAERHRLSTEALDDGIERLDFVEWDGGVRNSVEQIAKENGPLLLGQFFKR